MLVLLLTPPQLQWTWTCLLQPPRQQLLLVVPLPPPLLLVKAPSAHRTSSSRMRSRSWQPRCFLAAQAYRMQRQVLSQLQFNVVKFEPNGRDNSESKVYLGKPLPAELVRDHRSVRTVVVAE